MTSYPNTPPGAEAKLAAYSDALDGAMEALPRGPRRRGRREDARDAARRRAPAIPRLPEGRRLQRVRTTVAYQAAWIEEQIADEEHKYQVKKLARQAASEHLKTLGKQGSFQQSLTRSVGDAYRGTGRWTP